MTTGNTAKTTESPIAGSPLLTDQLSRAARHPRRQGVPGLGMRTLPHQPVLRGADRGPRRSAGTATSARQGRPVAELVDVRRITTPESLRYVLGANEVTLATTPGAGTPGSWATSGRCPSRSRRAARRASGGGMHRLISRPLEVLSGEHP